MSAWCYSPLGHGFLTGQIRSTADISDDDWRKTNPRFVGENFEPNLRIVDEVQAVAADAGATPLQIERLNKLAPAAGERHDEGNLAAIDS